MLRRYTLRLGASSSLPKSVSPPPIRFGVNDAPQQPTDGGGATATLAVAGGPSAWMQAYAHLERVVGPTNNNERKVLMFRPKGQYSLWESSGRQISVREKVTKFLNPWGVPKTVEASPDFVLSDRFVKMGMQFVDERLFDTHHMKLVNDVRESFAAYENVNKFLVEKAGEKPILRATGRLVIAGKQEYHDLYRHVFKWRKERDMVQDDQVERMQHFLKEYSGLLFNEGYTGYSLQCGGFVVKDAEEVMLRGLQKCFGGKTEQFELVDGRIESVASANNTKGFQIGCAVKKGESEHLHYFNAEKLYLSTGSTPLLQGQGDAQMIKTRLCPPIEITGHSGVIVQRLAPKTVEAILKKSGCSSLDDFFCIQPGAFMTDDFELTFEKVVENTASSSSSSSSSTTTHSHEIHWRVTGGAQINAPFCRNDPMKSLFQHVERFLHKDSAIGDGSSVTVRDDGFHPCTRQVGPTVREQYIGLKASPSSSSSSSSVEFEVLGDRTERRGGKDGSCYAQFVGSAPGEGMVGINWGHLGVTLAGLNTGLQ